MRYAGERPRRHPRESGAPSPESSTRPVDSRFRNDDGGAGMMCAFVPSGVIHGFGIERALESHPIVLYPEPGHHAINLVNHVNPV